MTIAPITARETAKAKAETDRALERLRKELFDAGHQWARAASYGDIKAVATAAAWARGDHDGREFHAGAKAFFETRPKD
jgi:hypothetical protein